MPKLSIIMPVYNEKETMEEIISRVKTLSLDKEITAATPRPIQFLRRQP